MAVRRPIGPATEWLEVRTLLAAVPAPSPATATASTISVVIDYSLDANHFFDTQQKRDLLQQAADGVTKWFRDALLPINPGGGDEWEAVFDNPATGQRQTKRDLSIGANEVVLFAGGRARADARGRGAPGGYNATGSPGWLARVGRRGQAAAGAGAPDFGPWGGAIPFDTTPASPWFFG